jgi:hypothetical protein
MASIPGDLTVGSNDFGRVAAFERTASTWRRTDTLIGNQESGGNFGRAIDIDSDRAVIVATNAVYVFEHRGKQWKRIAKATLDPAKATFSNSVKLQQEQLFVHVYEAADDPFSKSAVYVYAIPSEQERGSGQVRTGRNEPVKTLRRTAVLRPPHGALNTAFGEDIALDRNVLVIGAPDGDNTGGSAYVYARFDCRWQLIDRLMPVDGTVADRFGASVDVRGRLIVVGAPRADLGLEDDEGYGRPLGDVYVFLPSRQGWYQSQRLNTISDGYAIRSLGYKVRLGRDLLAVRTPDLRGLARGEDRVFVYDWSNGSFQYPREVAIYEGHIPDIDMSGRQLIYSLHAAEFWSYYQTGSAKILRFGQP